MPPVENPQRRSFLLQHLSASSGASQGDPLPRSVDETARKPKGCPWESLDIR